MGPARWGICGAGMVCRKFALVLSTLPSDQHQVVAVGARKLDNAQAFAGQFDICNAYGSYEELAQDPEVDVVYIGAIHPAHARLSKLMLNAGKHVLCEKPMAMNVKEATEVLQLAKEKRLFFMEAFWSRFFPAYQQLRTELDAGTIGEPRMLTANLSFNMAQKSRIVEKELGGGVLLDLGCYTIQLAELVFGGKPEKVVSTGVLQPTGVDEAVSITLHFSGNRLAVLSSSMNCTSDCTATVCGPKGAIKIPLLHCPTEIITPTETYCFPLPECKSQMSHANGTGMVYEAEAVRECLLRGESECGMMPHHSSLTIMEVMDEVRRQLGVVYGADA